MFTGTCALQSIIHLLTIITVISEVFGIQPDATPSGPGPEPAKLRVDSPKCGRSQCGSSVSDLATKCF